MVGFWGLVLRYLVALAVLTVARLVAARREWAGPKQLSLLFVAGNLAVLGYLVGLDLDSGGRGFLTSLARVGGAMLLVLVPGIAAAVWAAERRDTSRKTGAGDPPRGPDGGG